MAIRETLNQQKHLGIGIGAGLFVLALGLIWYFFLMGESGLPVAADQHYFATDLSSTEAAVKSLVPLDRGTLSPATHSGKSAYRAHVYSADGGKTKLIGYFERISDAAKPRVEALISKLKQAGQPEVGIESAVTDDLDMNGGLEIRFPDSDKWLPIERARPQIAQRLAKQGAGAVEISP
ncbi:MAG: hypothetical protein H7144_12555 [Burkholderiales bacterium]|nr:hypothetical protein [Phycisphaerae bacterium]